MNALQNGVQGPALMLDQALKTAAVPFPQNGSPLVAGHASSLSANHAINISSTITSMMPKPANTVPTPRISSMTASTPLRSSVPFMNTVNGQGNPSGSIHSPTAVTNSMILSPAMVQSLLSSSSLWRVNVRTATEMHLVIVPDPSLSVQWLQQEVASRLHNQQLVRFVREDGLAVPENVRIMDALKNGSVVMAFPAVYNQPNTNINSNSNNNNMHSNNPPISIPQQFPSYAAPASSSVVAATATEAGGRQNQQGRSKRRRKERPSDTSAALLDPKNLSTSGLVSEFNSAVLSFKSYSKYFKPGEKVSFPEEIIGKFKQVYHFCSSTGDSLLDDKRRELKHAATEYLNMMGVGYTIETPLTTHVQPTNIERIPLKDIPGFEERLHKVGLLFLSSLHSLLCRIKEEDLIPEEQLKAQLMQFAGSQNSETTMELYNRITTEITNTWPKSHVLVLCNLLGCNVLMPGKFIRTGKVSKPSSRSYSLSDPVEVMIKHAAVVLTVPHLNAVGIDYKFIREYRENHKRAAATATSPVKTAFKPDPSVVPERDPLSLTEEQAVKLLSTNLFGFSPRQNASTSTASSDGSDLDEDVEDLYSDEDVSDMEHGDDEDEEDEEDEEIEETNGRPHLKRRKSDGIAALFSGVQPVERDDTEWRPNHKGATRRRRLSKGVVSDDGTDESPTNSPPLPNLSSPTSGDPNAPTLLEAAVQVLADQRKKGVHALKINQIWDLIVHSGILVLKSKTPKSSLSARLTEEVKKMGDKSVVVRVGPGLYSLRNGHDMNTNKLEQLLNKIPLNELCDAEKEYIVEKILAKKRSPSASPSPSPTFSRKMTSPRAFSDEEDEDVRHQNGNGHTKQPSSAVSPRSKDAEAGDNNNKSTSSPPLSPPVPSPPPSRQ